MRLGKGEVRASRPLRNKALSRYKFYHDPLIQGTNDLQELSKTHDIVSRSKTELWHRILTHYLPLYFPEADRFPRSSRSDWLLAFLERYPSPHFISAMGRDAFIADAWAVVGRRVSKERLLSDIYDTAASSVGLPVEPDSDAIAIFRMVLAEPQGPVTHRDLWRDREAAGLDVDQELAPALGALPHSDLKPDEFLLSLRRGSDDHQHALGLRLHPGLKVDTVRPDVDVAPGGEIAALPALVVRLPFPGQARQDTGRKVRGVLPEQSRQGLLEVARRNATQIQDRQQRIEAA